MNKLISAALAISIIFSFCGAQITAAAPAAGGADALAAGGADALAAAPATENADALAELGLFRGTENGYELDAQVTRAQAVTMAIRYMGLDGSPSQGDAVFTDVPPAHWAADAVYNALALGITKGTSATTFDPERQVTDLEFITFILRAIGFAEAEPGTAAKQAADCGVVGADYQEIDDFKRMDMVDICYVALGAAMAGGQRVCDYLAANGVVDASKLPEGLRPQPSAGPAEAPASAARPSASPAPNANPSPNPSPSSTPSPSPTPVRLNSGGGSGSGGSGSGGGKQPGGNDTGVEPPASLAFDVKLMDKLDDGGNIVFSPFSIRMAFMMAANGASGKTRQEMLDVLCVDDLDAFNQSAKSATEPVMSVEIGNGYAIRNTMAFDVGNSIWLNRDYDAGGILPPGLFKDTFFAPPFSSIVQECYRGASSVVGKENRATTVNEWVEEKTNGKIKDALPGSDDFDYLSALVNTIYFKAEWLNQFNKDLTKPGLFTNKDGTKTEADFMNMTSYMEYFENSKFQAVELPYFTGNGSHISMYVFLPKDSSAEIDASDMEKAFQNKATEYVSLSLPKFATDFKDEQLNDKLRQLGIMDAFDQSAADFRDTFTNLPDGYNIFITFVIHQAFIEIDEEGTEAAAATIIGSGGGGAPTPPPPKAFIADRPFAYAIRDNGSGDIYFMGLCRYIADI